MANESPTACAVLSTEAGLETALADSYQQPLVLLKHSEWCDRSRRVIDAALAEIETWAAHIGCRVVIVQSHRKLSDAVARLLGIRHETPQVVLIRNGQVIWHAAHFDVTSEALRRAIAAELRTDARGTGNPPAASQRRKPALSERECDAGD